MPGEELLRAALWIGKIQGGDRRRIDRQIQEYSDEVALGQRFRVKYPVTSTCYAALITRSSSGYNFPFDRPIQEEAGTRESDEQPDAGLDGCGGMAEPLRP